MLWVGMDTGVKVNMGASAGVYVSRHDSVSPFRLAPTLSSTTDSEVGVSGLLALDVVFVAVVVGFGFENRGSFKLSSTSSFRAGNV